MDPLSALSVAASVVQFVSFARDIVRQIDEAASSGRNELREHADIKRLAQQLQDLSMNFKKTLDPKTLHRKRTDAEQLLSDVAEDCWEKAGALLSMLKDLEGDDKAKDAQTPEQKDTSGDKSKNGKYKIKLSNVQHVLKAAWKHQDITMLHQRLIDSRAQLMAGIIASLR